MGSEEEVIGPVKKVISRNESDVKVDEGHCKEAFRRYIAGEHLEILDSSVNEPVAAHKICHSISCRDDKYVLVEMMVTNINTIKDVTE